MVTVGHQSAWGPFKQGALGIHADHTAMKLALPSGNLGLSPPPIPGSVRIPFWVPRVPSA